MTERLHFYFSLSCIGEGNGNPLQCSCLEKTRDRGAWWAAVYGVSQSQTRLKRLSSSSSRCFPGDSVVKNLLSSAGDLREVCLIPGSGRSPGGGRHSFLGKNSLVFLLEKFHGQRSLVDYILWGCKELDMTE